ncbi:KaiC domain-containing protein [Halobaculum magnesiiphilum]|uniref:KaiC domain-containing protein n=1 Tax=Halobaculum magnesiiphilum TaxID=1017351 RepID=A0A8T8WC43_9EURY|nr:KaiC domain-containing protein [Halobaculum magnesiiphilum]QZP37376.1 KaiC domain-containing protein [Halobaculum magnesiiphilum]
MSDDEDWFERALREDNRDDDDGDEPDDERADDADGADDAGGGNGADGANAADGAEDEAAGVEDDIDGDRDAPSPDDSPLDVDVDHVDEEFDDIDDGSLDAAFADDFEGDATDAAEPESVDGDGFDGEEIDAGGFGGLDGNGGVDDGPAADPFGGPRDEPDGDATDGSEPVDRDGGDATDDPESGDRDADPAEDPFGEGFGAAMRNTPGAGGPDGGAGGGGPAEPGSDDFGGGFGDFGGDFGGGGPEFDEEEFDSDIARIDIGIEGLDEMILGGVPERSLMAVIGSAGTGKTTFGLQFLNEALENDGDAVYITLEESKEAILSTAEEKGWEYRRFAEEDRLAVVAMDPIEMANSLDSIRDDISRLVTEFDADRLVLDSVSLLEMMYDHPSKRRSEVFDFARSLKRAGVTTMLTSEASEDNPYASRHGIVEYLTDAVFVLQYVRPSDFRETRLAVEIQKIRDANHSRETKPYEIMSDGISVYRQANIF